MATLPRLMGMLESDLVIDRCTSLILLVKAQTWMKSTMVSTLATDAGAIGAAHIYTMKWLMTWMPSSSYPLQISIQYDDQGFVGGSSYTMHDGGGFFLYLYDCSTDFAFGNGALDFGDTNSFTPSYDCGATLDKTAIINHTDGGLLRVFRISKHAEHGYDSLDAALSSIRLTAHIGVLWFITDLGPARRISRLHTV
jgi:hypothetical protein